jgi:hypothetical protein
MKTQRQRNYWPGKESAQGNIGPGTPVASMDYVRADFAYQTGQSKGQLRFVGAGVKVMNLGLLGQAVSNFILAFEAGDRVVHII